MFRIATLIALLSTSSIPLADPTQWEEASFNGVTPNQVVYGGEGMSISVRNSASPVIHLFSSPAPIRSVSVAGRVDGSLGWPDDGSWPDDAILRVGIVVAGGKPPSPLSLIGVPDWVKRLQSKVAHFDLGVESVRTFLVLPDESAIGNSRSNPSVDLFEETVAAAPDEDGNFSFEKSFPEVDAIGIWILADGDDTGSSFSVTMENLEFN